MRSREAYLRSLVRAREKAAAKAIAEGRVPGRVGQPPKNYKPEEVREKLRLKSAKYRAENLEASRKYKREYEQKRAAERAIAAGRLPGKSGPAPKILTDEERRAKQNARVTRYYYENLEKSRAAAAKREREKRAAIKAGTYNPRSKARNSLEHRSAVTKSASHARRARLANAGRAPTAEEIKKLRWRQNGICPCCQRALGSYDLHLDHWLSLKHGGTNEFDNLRLTHGACNLKKGTKHPDELRQPYEVRDLAA